MKTRFALAWLSVALSLLPGLLPRAQAGSVTLKRSFIETYKDRATIDASFTVDHAHRQPNPAAKDGDMHVAGRSQKQVGLPMVAEVMNASADDQVAAVNEIHKDEGDNQPVAITGAWRLWFEHPSAEPQIQGAVVEVPGNTNPDHCFEIHPITTFAGNAVPNSFQFVDGFAPYDANKAFGSYEKLTVALQVTDTAVTITSPKAGYNYTQFFLEFVGKSKPLKDGGAVVLANVLAESQGEPVAENIRMIFVPGTRPAAKLAKEKPGDGDEWHVMGIPRVSLAGISSWIQQGGGSVTKRKLPYEIIIVGVE
jgi:hypothetical protein